MDWFFIGLSLGHIAALCALIYFLWKMRDAQNGMAKAAEDFANYLKGDKQ